jgi:Ni/Fe-hydrogenase 1 B-type cytochrome subunit
MTLDTPTYLKRSAKTGQVEVYRRVQRVTATWRIIHWVQALSVVVCFITGLYIAKPFIQTSSIYSAQPFPLMAWSRALHFYGAMILDTSLILIAYLYLFSRSHRDITDLRPTPEHRSAFNEAALNFITFNRRRRFDTTKRDPLLAVMFVLLHLLLLLQALTGLQLYVASFSDNLSTVGSWWPQFLHITTDWTATVFGGNVGVRMTHLTTSWLIIAWAVFHIYYEIWRTIMWREGDIGIMFSGSKYVRVKDDANGS